MILITMADLIQEEDGYTMFVKSDSIQCFISMLLKDKNGQIFTFYKLIRYLCREEGHGPDYCTK